MTAKNTTKGPRRHRLLIWIFTAVFGLLLFWLLGFVVDDIGSWPGPDYQTLDEQMLDGQLVTRTETLDAEIDQIRRTIEAGQKRQARLRESTNNSQQTMNQLLDIQRLSLEKDVKPTPDEQNALAEAESLFLANQKRFQELNDQIAEEEEQLRQLEDQKREADEALSEAREPIREEYDRLQSQHRVKIGAAKLAFLIPLLIVAAALALKKRDSAYVMLIYALGIAVSLKVTTVMHEHFPKEYFKYILILVSIAIVLRILVYLLTMLAHPKKAWLSKQYREAYESFFCPVCAYPIRRGPLKYLSWTARSLKKMRTVPTPATGEEEPYTCPACTTRLYEPCESCGTVRPSLLPACDHCGAVKSLGEETDEPTPGEPA